MRRCFSAPTPSKPAGKSCNRSSTLGQTSRRGISRITPQAAAALLRPTNCWRAMAAPGGRSTEQSREIDGREAQDFAGAGGRGWHPRHRRKDMTERARKAVSALQEAGIRFAITSGRPPLGMAMLFDVLDIETPIAGFNGGLFVKRDLSILEQKTVPADVAHHAIDLMRAHALDTWVYSGNDWLITKAVAPHVAREAWTVKFQPKVVPDVRTHLQQVAKIVGVSDDLAEVQRCEAEAQAAFSQRATANRSQPYYLDVTNKDANKGAVVEYLAQHVGVPAEEIATIGDQPNDVLMFKRSGFSIAMGNASREVKAQAAAVTDSYNDEGFAKAMEVFILDPARR